MNAELRRIFAELVELPAARQEQALERYLSSGTGSSLPTFYAMLAENRLREGRLDEAAAVIRTALERIESFGEQCYLPECRRIEAAVRLQQGAGLGETRGILEDALGVARRQGAKGWELRLVRDLARVLVEAGEVREAGDLLAPVLEGMAEGRQTADFLEAEAVLRSV